ncbi:MAG TPA: RluA family pseudouridine synthase [Candidatus Omnitrophota bacterium]|nr:RluA family pseudouridine synthase [Candidatus Omnitrophota bacterium]
MRTFTVKDPALLLEYLFKKLSDTKKTRVRQCLKFGSVLVNDKVVTRFDHPLMSGDKVSVCSVKESQPVVKPQFGIEVMYEDDAIIVIRKPAGLLTISTEKIAIKTAFFATNEYLCERDSDFLRLEQREQGRAFRKKKIFVVHRLDREASGLLVFAKTLEAKQQLQSHWSEVTKKYYAVVTGMPEKAKGTITSFLRENKFLNVYSSKRPEDAKLSTTRYQVLHSTEKYSLLEIKLETGRKHQIRVHLSEMGNPILGDERYGSKARFTGDGIALHAYYLAFAHPASGQPMIFRSPLPQSFEEMLWEERKE